MAGLYGDASLIAGELDRRLTIQRAKVGRDKFNNPLRVWSDLVTVWGSKLDVSDSERIAAEEKGSSITTRFQLRYSKQVAAISPLDRIYENFTKRTYDIVAVKEIGRRVGLEISARARLDLNPTGELNPQ